MGASVSRNSPCACGSGRKYKRCCLAEGELAARAARFDSEVGLLIQRWASEALSEEVSAALEEYVGPERTIDDGQLEIFATWFHSDRLLPSGDTPAERYAARPDLPEDERAAATRIADAELGLHRVLAVEPGSWLVLDDIVRGTRARVRSQNVSREAVVWDILLGRVMAGDPPSLWGPTRFFEPSDEPEVLAELERLAGVSGQGTDDAGLCSVLRSHALELMRFTPQSWDVEPSFFTLEGDPVAFGSAIWQVRDPEAAGERLRALGGLARGEALEVDITVAREALVRDRPQLPRGAIVLESGPIDDPGTVPVATVRLEGAELHAEAISRQRLENVIQLVERDFGDLAELSNRELAPVEERLRERRAAPAPPAALPPGLTAADERRLVGGFMTERMRRWLDEPHPQLDGRTPRAAVVGKDRAEVVRLVRGIENGAERATRRGEPFADVAWIRQELGLESELAA